MDEVLSILNLSPVLSALLVMVPIIGIAWKIFHELYVKPRDFKIDSLKDDLSRLTTELERVSNAQQRSVLQQISPDSNVIETRSDSLVVSQKSPSASSVLNPGKDKTRELQEQAGYSSPQPLSSLADLVSQWKDPQKTELQKQAFEAEYVGKDVEWVVKVESVSKASGGNIALSAVDSTYQGSSLFGPSALIFFPERDAKSLLSLKKDDVVTIRGRISRFFLSPMLEQATIV